MMIIFFKCYLADGNERTHSSELQVRSSSEAVKLIEEITEAIQIRMEQGRVLPMPSPATYYAPGQVKYVEISLTDEIEDLEREVGQVVNRKLGFIKE